MENLDIFDLQGGAKKAVPLTFVGPGIPARPEFPQIPVGPPPSLASCKTDDEEIDLLVNAYTAYTRFLTNWSRPCRIGPKTRPLLLEAIAILKEKNLCPYRWAKWRIDEHVAYENKKRTEQGKAPLKSPKMPPITRVFQAKRCLDNYKIRNIFRGQTNPLARALPNAALARFHGKWSEMQSILRLAAQDDQFIFDSSGFTSDPRAEEIAKSVLDNQTYTKLATAVIDEIHRKFAEVERQRNEGLWVW